MQMLQIQEIPFPTLTGKSKGWVVPTGAKVITVMPSGAVGCVDVVLLFEVEVEETKGRTA